VTDRDHVGEILANWERERPDLDASPIGVFGRIARINRRLDTHLDKFLYPHGLTLGLFDVLAALRRVGHPHRAKPSELAATSLLTSGGMTGRLDQLEGLGLVKRVSDPNDRRVTFAQLSAGGLALIDTLFAEHLKREAALLSGLGAEQQIQLAALLEVVESTVSANRSL